MNGQIPHLRHRTLPGGQAKSPPSTSRRVEVILRIPACRTELSQAGRPTMFVRICREGSW
jgi:hypothetical protein